jgi:hypothetical protein
MFLSIGALSKERERNQFVNQVYYNSKINVLRYAYAWNAKKNIKTYRAYNMYCLKLREREKQKQIKVVKLAWKVKYFKEMKKSKKMFNFSLLLLFMSLFSLSFSSWSYLFIFVCLLRAISQN